MVLLTFPIFTWTTDSGHIGGVVVPLVSNTKLNSNKKNRRKNTMKNRKPKRTLKYQKRQTLKVKRQTLKTVKNNAIFVIKQLIAYAINFLGLCPKPLINFEFNLINISLNLNQNNPQVGVIVNILGLCPNPRGNNFLDLLHVRHLWAFPKMLFGENQEREVFLLAIHSLNTS